MDKYYADYDEDTGSYCVFNSDTGKAYSSWQALKQAERAAKELNIVEEYRNTETMFGENIFSYTYKGYQGDEKMMSSYYLNVEFPYNSMKKYNGNDVIKDDDGTLRILKEKDLNSEKYLWSGFIMDILEFRELLFNRYKEEGK